MPVEINTRTIEPYRATAYIETTWPDGSRTRASGVVVGTNDVLTALHVVFDASRGGNAASLRISPGADTLPRFDAPFGTFTDVGRINGRVANWDQNGDGLLFASESQSDLALIGLRSRIGDTTGIEPVIAAATDINATILGYPGAGTGLIQDQALATASGQFSVYDLDTGLGAGASGGPLLLTDSAGRNFVAGVLSSGNASDTRSTYAGLFGNSNLDWLTQAINGNDDLIGGVGSIDTLGVTSNYGPAVAVRDDYAANTSTSGRLTLGVANTGNIETGGDNDWFGVTLQAGRYRFDVQGSDSRSGSLIDPFLTLYNAAGISVASDDDTGVGRDALLITDITTAGTYFLGARSFSTSGTGTYSITASLVSTFTPATTAFVTNGTSGNDTFAAAALPVSSSGTARVVAGAGRDIITFVDSAANYRLSNPGNGDLLAVDRVGASGASSSPFLEATGVNILQFSDRTLFVLTESQAQVARLYEAAFNRSPDFVGLDFWLGVRSAGNSVASIAQSFTTSAEYQNLYTGLGNQQFVERLYQNVLNRPGEASGINFWTDALGRGATQSQVLSGFSDSIENVTGTQGPQGFVQLIGVNA